MLASFTLLLSFVQHARRQIDEATVNAPSSSTTASRPAQDEQRELDQWLFDRDSRWQREM